jgi:asparagine synthase (glutamine-hydrolysing)
LSAFAVIYQCANTPGDPVVFNRIMDRLNHRGPDGHDVFVTNTISMGHWHFWTTPEEVGERQPIQLNGLPFRIVFDGRIDNRDELFVRLHNASAEGRILSDAGMVLAAYLLWGEKCLDYFIGEYAFAIFDEQRAELFCARDSMGDRTLFYSATNQQIVIASEPWAVAAAKGTVAELDESAVAHYFALKINENGQTLFKNIYELLPAHMLMIKSGSHYTRRFWSPDPFNMIRRRSDEEYAERFLFLLEESVRCRMRSCGPVGVLMSGGLDSTSIACLMARRLAPQKLTSISYVFDKFKECDERDYINAIRDRWQLHSIQIPSDDAWPYKEWTHRPRNPNHPEINIYRLQAESVYNRAREEGLQVLMTGTYGDHLYSAGADWIADLILDGHILDTIKELFIQVYTKGLIQTLSANHLRRLARRMLDLIFPGLIRLPRKTQIPNWINSACNELLIDEPPGINPVFERHGYLLNSGPSGGVSREIPEASRHKIELRHPFRDRRLIEFVLALPAYQFHRLGLYKHVLRVAMGNILPEDVRTRTKSSSLLPFYIRGVENEKMVLSKYFQDKNAKWRKFVKVDWLLKNWDRVLSPEKDGSELVVPWLCASFEAWYNSSVLLA